MDLEPIGEERADLRMGALASVILNMNLDTKSLGGALQPLSYISGWGRDRVYVLALKPEEIGEISHSDTLNNPINWQNFKTGLIKVYSK